MAIYRNGLLEASKTGMTPFLQTNCDLDIGAILSYPGYFGGDLDEFREFCVNSLAKIAGVGNVKSNICMKQVKYSTALPMNHSRS